MSKELKDFLHKLADDPETLRRFREDPHGVMAEHDVPDEHKQMVLDGDKESIKQATGADDAEVSKFVV